MGILDMFRHHPGEVDGMGNGAQEYKDLAEVRAKQAAKQEETQGAKSQALEEASNEAGVVSANPDKISARADEISAEHAIIPPKPPEGTPPPETPPNS